MSEQSLSRKNLTSRRLQTLIDGQPRCPYCSAPLVERNTKTLRCGACGKPVTAYRKENG